MLIPTIGWNATSDGARSVALGSGSNITGLNDTFALGANVNLTNAINNSVYLGYNTAYISDTTKSAKNGAYNSATITNSNGKSVTISGFAGATPSGVVSVGNATNTRRIQGVSAGLVSATSTDAINGSQLYALAGEVADLKSNSNTGWTLSNGTSSNFKVISQEVKLVSTDYTVNRTIDATNNTVDFTVNTAKVAENLANGSDTITNDGDKLEVNTAKVAENLADGKTIVNKGGKLSANIDGDISYLILQVVQCQSILHQ